MSGKELTGDLPPPVYQASDRGKYNIIVDTDGLYYLTSQTKVAQHVQPDDKAVVPHVVHHDNIVPEDKYPWNLSLEYPTDAITLCVSNCEIIVKRHGIGSNKPFLIDIQMGHVTLWSPEYREHRVITSKGSSVPMGWDVFGCDGKNMTVEHKFNFTSWNANMAGVKNLKIVGDKNKVTIDSNILDPLCCIEMCNYNDLLISQHQFDDLTLTAAYGSVALCGSDAQQLTATIQGSCKVHGLRVIHQADVKIIGPGHLTMATQPNTIVRKEIFGEGKVTIR